MTNDIVEKVAAALWKAEAERAAPTVAKSRTLLAFREDIGPTDKSRWLGIAQAAIAACADHFRLDGVKMGLRAAERAVDRSVDASTSGDCCLYHVGYAIVAIRNLDAEAIVKETK